ncbi:contactin-associated protein-like 2 isoform X2 [Pecten maximus]|uniref:contactin-associated protein-like 2 isoform X2 n=1 Tax=Pecten maximus TaxID=6579 RepID=UPI001458C33D|nr:contactin-associated protein-like 2 isoform X2 [Pecten maximus]
MQVKKYEHISAGDGSCDFDLVTGPYGVSDGALSASSYHFHCPIQDLRINSSNSWCPSTSGDGHYVQVEFQTVSTLKAIQTRGRHYNEWVASYSVNISMDGLTWSYILNSAGDVKVFPGNVDDVSIVTNNLEGNIVAKYIRVISVSGNGAYHRSMSLEVQGCPVVSPLTCSCTGNTWKATLGSTGDVFPVLVDTDASNQGFCGLKCSRQPDCDSFLFDTGPDRCRLLNSTSGVSNQTMNLDGVWYFVRP